MFRGTKKREVFYIAGFDSLYFILWTKLVYRYTNPNTPVYIVYTIKFIVAALHILPIHRAVATKVVKCENPRFDGDQASCEYVAEFSDTCRPQWKKRLLAVDFPRLEERDRTRR